MISTGPISSQLSSQLLEARRINSRQLEQMGQANPAQSAGPVSSTGSFGKVMGKLVNEVDAQMKTSQTERTKVLTGESSNLHQAMIASQESNVAFTFMVELRNKLVESYQELMRAQV